MPRGDDAHHKTWLAVIMHKDTNLEQHFIPPRSAGDTLAGIPFLFLPSLTGSGFPRSNNLLEGYKSVMTSINTSLSHWPTLPRCEEMTFFLEILNEQ